MDVVREIFRGNKQALSRLISLVENQAPELIQWMPKIYQKSAKKGEKRTPVVGITGPPGAGKSTLVDHLIRHLRSEKKTVAVLAIDPSSPFSGGAVLGDRIRMQSHASDTDVYIRSVGSRGSYGGLSRATKQIVRVLDAFGFDLIIIETVGVGQTELNIMEIADTTVVILVPESGDTIQTLKAGLLEIANIFVVNKSDREGACEIQAQLSEMVHGGGLTSTWEIPVLKTEATQGLGVLSLWENIQKHNRFLNKNKRLLLAKRKQELRGEFLEIVLHEYHQWLLQKSEREPFYKKLFCDVENEKKDPYSAALELFKRK